MKRNKVLIVLLQTSAMVVVAMSSASASHAVTFGWNGSTHTPTSGQVNNLATADNAVAMGTQIGSAVFPNVNYLNSAGDGNFPGGVQPAGLTGAADDFSVLSTGHLQITMDGDYQFRNNTDDGSRLRLDLNQDGVFGPGEDIIVDDVLSAPHDAFSATIFLEAGQYRIEHIWFERNGGAEGETGISKDGGAFLLFGSRSQAAASQFGVTVTTTQIVPEPTSAALALLGVSGLLMRRRRTA